MGGFVVGLSQIRPFLLDDKTEKLRVVVCIKDDTYIDDHY